MVTKVVSHFRNFIKPKTVSEILPEQGIVKAIQDSGLFDARWYLEQNPDVKAAGMDPALHYVQFGAREGRNPTPEFHTRHYLAAHPDVATAKLNPLFHYLTHGRTGNCKPAPELQVKAEVVPPKAAVPAVTYGLDCYFSVLPTVPEGKPTGRIAVFASFSADATVPAYVVHYLRHLRPFCDKIIFVADNDFREGETLKLQGLADFIITGRHEEYDFGSYKRGIALAKASGLLSKAQELLLCNDSSYGPVHGFAKLFKEMARSDADFWGLTDNSEFGYHLQSYFVLFRRAVFSKLSFFKFFDGVKKENKVSDIVLKYEVQMTAYFTGQGFRVASFISNDKPDIAASRRENTNLTHVPQLLMDAGSPLIKVKAFTKAKCNSEGVGRVLRNIQKANPHLHACIVEHAKPGRFTDAEGIRFSIIMPFHNRRGTIFRAIDSVLGQGHQAYELILVDDGSTDGASHEIAKRYAGEIKNGMIKLLRSADRNGVSAARNAGLAAAGNTWIAYLDSDNYLKPNFLSSYADAIADHPKSRLFYSCVEVEGDGTVRGRIPFSRGRLLRSNYIDLGTLVHARDLFRQQGGFDTQMKRLVDWDLILRYTKDAAAEFIARPLMVYNDSQKDLSRISVSESLDEARIYLRKKHKLPFIVTTIIPTYNHAEFLAQAIESALAQKGNFLHEILICDDASQDGTAEIAKAYQAQYPALIRVISNEANLGVTGTFRTCFKHCSGDFIAVLEGDDYWTDPEKLSKQLRFLLSHPDCSMVFSMIDVLNASSGGRSLLPRQKKLQAHKLTGLDFLSDPSMNLIANFSSCMFKTGLIHALPERLFQGRFNEIGLAFHLERYGYIGFIHEAQGVYRQHSRGVWSGSAKRAQLEMAIEVRRGAKDVAAPAYRQAIQADIDRLSNELKKLMRRAKRKKPKKR